ncbi:transglutaminase domain-containing protein [Aquabacterium sp.]|uniref:transglutaminase domain-containing protein n=1 Tax=Aquabacterium sp. TaxID=1872578 RepID=UPI003D6D2F1A
MKFLIRLSVLGLLLISGLLMLTSVDTEFDAADELIFTDVFKLTKNHRGADYLEELDNLRKVQQLVMSIAPVGDPIPDYLSREPADLVRHRSGLCYDRSRTFDKVYKWMGFETRHIYILYKGRFVNYFPQALAPLMAFFSYGQPSHAVTEVKTSRGWVLVDSNSEWIAVDKLGNPVPADDIWKSKLKFSTVPAYMLEPYWAIRGMYSRRGHLYRPYIPFPEFNVPDLVAWAYGD